MHLERCNPKELPAGGPRVYVTAGRTPHISDVTVRRSDDPERTERTTAFARVGDTLVVRGSGFADVPNVRVGGGDLELTPGVATADRVEVVVPDASLPDGRPIDGARAVELAQYDTHSAVP